MRQRVDEQKRLVESLRQDIQAEQRRAERELERDQAHLRQQRTESMHSFSGVHHFKVQTSHNNVLIFSFSSAVDS